MSAINITPSKVFAAGEVTSLAKFNLLGAPVGVVPAASITETELAGAVVTKLNTLANAIVSVSAKSADFAILTGDKGKLFDVTTAATDVTATLPAAASSGTGWYVWVRKADTGTGKVLTSIAAMPNAFALAKQDQKALIYGDGTNYYVLFFGFSADSNGNMFTRSTFIAIGGNDATVPALKRNGTTMLFRLGDDTADAPISALDGIFSGRVSNSDDIALGDLTGAAAAIDASKGNSFYGRLTGNVTGLTVSNMKNSQTITVKLLQDGTGSRTVAWTGIAWPSATAPTQTATANKYDVYTLKQIQGAIVGNQLANFT